VHHRPCWRSLRTPSTHSAPRCKHRHFLFYKLSTAREPVKCNVERTKQFDGAVTWCSPTHLYRVSAAADDSEVGRRGRGGRRVHSDDIRLRCHYERATATLVRYNIIHASITVLGIIRRNRSCSASDSAYSYIFLHSVVCLSVTFVPLLKPLDGCRCHLGCPMTHCVIDKNPWPHQEREGLEGRTAPAKTFGCRLMMPPGEYQRKVAWTAMPPFTKLVWSLLYVLYYCMTEICDRWRSSISSFSS